MRALVIGIWGIRRLPSLVATMDTYGYPLRHPDQSPTFGEPHPCSPRHFDQTNTNLSLACLPNLQSCGVSHTSHRQEIIGSSLLLAVLPDLPEAASIGTRRPCKLALSGDEDDGQLYVGIKFIIFEETSPRKACIHQWIETRF